MTHSLGPRDVHIKRVHHHLARVREARTQADQAAHDQAQAHYAANPRPAAPAAPGDHETGPTNG